MCAPTALVAQSLEETYAQLCSSSKQSETCAALNKALAEKRSGAGARLAATSAARAPGGRPPGAPGSLAFGPLVQLAGSHWACTGCGPGERVVAQTFSWVEGGAAIKFRQTDGLMITEIVFRPGREAGTLSANVELWLAPHQLVDYATGQMRVDAKKNVTFRSGDDGVLLSDWYRLAYTNMRDEIRLTQNGRYSHRHARAQGARPEFPALEAERFRRISAEELAAIEMRNAELAAVETRQADARNIEKRHAENLARLNTVTAVLGGVSQGLAEVNAETARANAQQEALMAEIRTQAGLTERQRSQTTEAPSSAGHRPAPSVTRPTAVASAATHRELSVARPASRTPPDAVQPVQTAYQFCRLRDLSTRTVYFSQISQIAFPTDWSERANADAFRAFLTQAYNAAPSEPGRSCLSVLSEIADSRGSIDRQFARQRSVDTKENWRIVDTSFAPRAHQPGD